MRFKGIFALYALLIVSKEFMQADSFKLYIKVNGKSLTNSLAVQQTRSKARCALLCAFDMNWCAAWRYVETLHQCHMSADALVDGSSQHSAYQLKSVAEMTSTATPSSPTMAPTTTAASCPPSYVFNPISNTCFFLSSVAKSWDEAKVVCQNDGNELVTFGTAEESQWLRTKVAEILLQESDYRKKLWIGGEHVTGDYQWKGRLTTNVPASGSAESDWGSFQPDLEECMGVDALNGWFDDLCHTYYHFICETV